MVPRQNLKPKTYNTRTSFARPSLFAGSVPFAGEPNTRTSFARPSLFTLQRRVNPIHAVVGCHYHTKCTRTVYAMRLRFALVAISVSAVALVIVTLCSTQINLAATAEQQPHDTFVPENKHAKLIMQWITWCKRDCSGCKRNAGKMKKCMQYLGTPQNWRKWCDETCDRCKNTPDRYNQCMKVLSKQSNAGNAATYK